LTVHAHRTALLFQDGNWVGPEYWAALQAAGLGPDLAVAVGRVAPGVMERETLRTGGRWRPAPIGQAVHRFASLKDPALWDFLRAERVDVAIQGGIGILKPDMLAVPRIGFVNVHPGRLPAYRGCTCPEWALWEGRDIWATAHLIDSGIDTGPVLAEGLYALQPDWDYYDIRAHLYAHCAQVLVQALRLLRTRPPEDAAALARPQPEAGARYLKPLPDADLAALIARLARPRRAEG
jgi:methionyl-tRNA formyltransferase